MNVHKRFDRFKQWTGERMGREAKTDATDEFKMLEVEMDLRHEGTGNPSKHAQPSVLICSFQA